MSVYMPLPIEKALELAVKKILYMENGLVTMESKEITVSAVYKIAQEGQELFEQMISGKYNASEVEIFQHSVAPLDELCDAYCDKKQIFFGKNQQSCSLHLFQTLIIQ